MGQMNDRNRQIVLANRPVGVPDNDTLRMDVGDIPAPSHGEMLLRTEYLSLDPYMRGRMNDAKSYAEPVGLGEVMVGGTVARVETSRITGFEKGDWVLSYHGWQDYALSDGQGVINLGKNPTNPSWALGVLGMPGFTAYAGLIYIGEPKAGETVVVAAATGAVGANVGQIAKLKGCRVVGVAGGADKCEYAVKELGFDACIDRNVDNLSEQIEAACPNGIDVYFENVGGAVFKAVLPLLNPNARIPLCGLISQYNSSSLPDGPDFSGAMMGAFLVKKIKVQGFIIFDDFNHKYEEFSQQMIAWIKNGDIKYREHLIEGLDNAPEAFIGLLDGKNFGKLVVKVAD